MPEFVLHDCLVVRPEQFAVSSARRNDLKRDVIGRVAWIVRADGEMGEVPKRDDGETLLWGTGKVNKGFGGSPADLRKGMAGTKGRVCGRLEGNP